MHVIAPVDIITVLKAHVPLVATTTMNETPPAKPRARLPVNPVTPSNMQPPAHDGSTPHLLDASEGPLDGHAKARLVRDALIIEFKSCTTTLPDDDKLTSYNFLFARHKVAQAEAQKIFDDLPRRMYLNGRWRKLPQIPQQESQIYEPFAEIMNHIIDNIPSNATHTLNDRWAAVSASKCLEQTNDTQRPSRKPQAAVKTIKTRPDIVILGKDPKLLPPNSPSADYYKTAISVGEIKPEAQISETNVDKVEETRAQLGSYARYVASRVLQPDANV